MPRVALPHAFDGSQSGCLGLSFDREADKGLLVQFSAHVTEVAMPTTPLATRSSLAKVFCLTPMETDEGKCKTFRARTEPRDPACSGGLMQ